MSSEADRGGVRAMNCKGADHGGGGRGFGQVMEVHRGFIPVELVQHSRGSGSLSSCVGMVVRDSFGSYQPWVGWSGPCGQGGARSVGRV